MKIATFNVNGINGRLPVLVRWLAEAKPDVFCAQELKAPSEKFPEPAIREAGLARPEELERRRHTGSRTLAMPERSRWSNMAVLDRLPQELITIAVTYPSCLTVDRALSDAAAKRDVLRLGLEWERRDAPVLSLTEYSGSGIERRDLACCDAHGTWVEWLAV
jgi:hypothetical protein